MPIQYAPPEAFDAETFSRASRGDVERQNAELGIRAFGVGAQAQNDFFRTAIASGAQRAEAGNMQARLVQDAYQFDEAVKARERLAGMEIQGQLAQTAMREQAALAAIDRRGEVQQFLQEMDPGFQDQQQYDRDLNKVRAIQDDPTMTQFEKDALISKMIPGAKMAQQRLQQAQQKRLEEANRQEQEDTVRRNGITKLLASGTGEAADLLWKKMPDGSIRRLKNIDEKGMPVFDWEKPEKPVVMNQAQRKDEAERRFPPDVFNDEKGTYHYSPERRQQMLEYLNEIHEREDAKRRGEVAAQPAGGGATVYPATDLPPIQSGQKPLPQQESQMQGIRDLVAMTKDLPDSAAAVVRSRLQILAEIVEQGMPSSRMAEYKSIKQDLMPLLRQKKQAAAEPESTVEESEFKKSLRRPLVAGR